MIRNDLERYTTIVNGEEVTHEWHGRYDITCPHCKHEMQCSPSIFQKMGDSQLGYGNCPDCDKGFRITHEIDDNTMTTKGFSDDL